MTPPPPPIDSGLELTDLQYQSELQSDAELLDLYVLGGQTQALLTLLLRFTPLMTGVIRRVVSHAQDAEDAFQASCLILMQSARQIRSRRSIAAWLYGVAYRTACRVRAKSRRQATGLDPLELPDAKQIEDPISQIVRQIELSNLDRELQNLPAGYREPLIEHYILGYTARQIAERMDLSSSAIEGRLRRGRQMLRERLAERGASLSVCVAGVTWMRNHQETLAHGQHLTENLVQSNAFQSPNKLVEHDPYLFELVTGETKMPIASFIKSAGFMGTFAAVTISLSVLAFALQQGVDERARQSAQSPGAGGLQTAPAQDDPTAASAVVESGQPPANNTNNANGASNPSNANNTSNRGRTSNSQSDWRQALGRNGPAADVINFVRPSSEPPTWLTGGDNDQAASEIVRDLLRKPVKLDFTGVSLREVMDECSKQLHVSIHIDDVSLDDAGQSGDAPINIRAESLPLHQALKLILAPLDLTYEVHPRLVKIVSVSDEGQAVRYYDLSHVLPNSASVRSLTESAFQLIEDDDDAPRLSVLGSMLIARCNETAHLQIEKLLAEVAKLSPENLPANESQAKGGGVFTPALNNGPGGMF